MGRGCLQLNFEGHSVRLCRVATDVLRFCGFFCFQELEIALDDERRAGEDARQAVTVLERKRIALQTELEDVRTLLETV